MSNNPLCIHLCTQYTQYKAVHLAQRRAGVHRHAQTGPQWDVVCYSDGYGGQVRVGPVLVSG